MQPPHDPEPDRTPPDVARWAWPAFVAVAVLLLVGETLTAADSGWPRGATIVAISMVGLVVLASTGWYRSRRRRD